MSLEENKKIYLRSLFEMWSEGNEDVVDEIFAEDFVKHDEGDSAAPKKGLEGRKQRLRAYRKAIPDLSFKAELVIAEGDLVACYYKGTGTHKGELLGIPATGKKFTFRGVDIMRIVDGKCVEAWDVPDIWAIMQQIGNVKGFSKPD